MLRQVEFAARFDLQEIPGLGQAIAFPDRWVSADGQQGPFLPLARSVAIEDASSRFVSGLAKCRVFYLVRLNQLAQLAGRLHFLPHGL